jgi:HEAT repeat protein
MDMAEERASSHFAISRTVNPLMIVATMIAAGMLVASYFTRMTPQVALLRGDPVDRVQAVEQLIQLGDQGISVLEHALNQSNREARISALFGLGRIGPRASHATKSVRNALQDPDPVIRSVAVGTFRHIHAQYDAVVPILVPMLDDSNSGVREAVEQMLEEISQHDIQMLVAALLREPENLRRRIWPVLHKVSKRGTLPGVSDSIRTMLDHSDPAIRDEALLTIVSWQKGSVAEIREVFEKGEIRCTSSGPDEEGLAAIDVALQAMANLGDDLVEFQPEVMRLLNSQEVLESRSNPNEAESPVPASHYELHSRFQNLLLVLSRMKSAGRSAIPILVHRMNELHEINRIPVARTLVDLECDPDVVVPVLVPLLVERFPDQVDAEFADRRRIYESSHQAAMVLIRASPDEARRQISLLLPRLGTSETGIDKDVLRSIAGLSSIADEAVATVLTPLVSDIDRDVRRLAIDALSRMGDRAAPAVPSLIALLELNSIDRDQELSRRIIKTLGQIGPGAKTASPSLLEAVQDPNRYVAQVIPTVVVGESGLNSGTMHWSELMRMTAISSLGQIGDSSPEVLSALCQQLSATMGDRRVAAAKALRIANDLSDQVLVRLVPLLNDEIATVRVQAALTIANLPGNREQAVTAMEELLSDKSSYVRQAAVMALGSIGTDARSALPKLHSLRGERGEMDALWYARMTGINMVPSWFDETLDFQPQTMDQAVNAAIASIEQETDRREESVSK